MASFNREKAISSYGENLPARTVYAEHEKAGVHAQKRRLAIRAKIGSDWDGRAANDNIAWPLATALIKEGNTELLKYAMLYRKIHDTAKSGSLLGGSSPQLGNGVSLDQRQWIKPNGEIAYKGVRKVAKVVDECQGRRKTQTDAEGQITSGKQDSGYTSVPKAWNGDRPVNDMIDAQKRLAGMQWRLGHLCEPFELACIDGKTLAEVGATIGISNRSGAQGAGRALVHTALITIRDMMGEVRRNDLTS
ncbi:hypothetical protein N5K21_20465 [Rhizobium pusense]|uniref:Uncharacterized protein n=1 Tax=Agrobacterium pusense TaxID=648995 RepID=A0A6H0ZKV8_9HYPH|nr:hypothetical protein [Agrobacterium pusense]MDH2091110.1 hypothetical protein [Agrobacterium pusense]QIX21428.1 hypothetical protein FOB41_09925 [Agrobacterium pusense]